MIRSGSGAALFGSGKLKPRGSGRLLGKTRVTESFLLGFTIHKILGLDINTNIHLCLSKLDGANVKSKKVVCNPNGSCETDFGDEILVGDVSLQSAAVSGYKQKLVKVLVRRHEDKSVMTSTHINVAEYVVEELPGIKVRIGMGNGVQAIATIACMKTERGKSPTSVMDTSAEDNGGRSGTGKLRASGSGFLGRKMKGFGSQRGIQRSGSGFFSAGGGRAKKQAVADRWQSVQNENARLKKMIQSTRENTKMLGQVTRKNEELKKELRELKKPTIDIGGYNELVKELCTWREERAKLELECQELEHKMQEFRLKAGTQKGRV